MKRKFGLLCMAVSIALLTACGSSYDSEIDEVIEAENEKLDKPSFETDVDILKRENTKIWVYEKGGYIELEYVTRGKHQTATPVYKYSEEKGRYVRYTDGNFNKSDVNGMEADYTENVEDDS